MRRIIVVGGGASGLFAAYSAAVQGNSVVLLEKNEKLGKKIYITGKGRCNLTNYITVSDFFNNVPTNPKFLYSSVNFFSPSDVYSFFENNGLKLKVERGNRVFPQSDKASDVTKTLEKCLSFAGVDIKLNTQVKELIVEQNIVKGVRTLSENIYCDSVIICTGGLSYSSTGSTGDGYKFATSVGHTVVEPKPSLVGVELVDNDFIKAQGLSLKNVSITTFINGKKIYSDFGEMLFTHFGVSGPIILSSSCYLNKYSLDNATISIDLKPAINSDVLNARVLRELAENCNKNIFNTMRAVLPKNLVGIVLSRAQVRQSKICSKITVEERNNIVRVIKNFIFKIKKLRPIDEAIITSGGVNVKEINPKTLESKLIKGLYFAGEVLDVDAFTGGFNLQIAFSTGYVAGFNA